MKKKRLPQTITELIDHFDGTGIAASLLAELEHLLPQYIMMNDREDRKWGYCTSCHQMVDVRQPSGKAYKHNDTIICHVCRQEVQIKHQWRGVKSLCDTALVYVYGVSVLDSEILTARAIYLRRSGRDIDEYAGPTQWDVDAEVDSFYVFVMGEGAIAGRPIHGMQIINAHGDWCKKEVQRNGLYEIVRNAHPRWGAYQNMGRNTKTLFAVHPGTIENAVKGTPFRYVWESMRKQYEEMPEDGDRDAGVVLFRYASLHPSVEWVAKMGLGKLLLEYFSQYAHCQYYKYKRYCPMTIQWNARSIKKVLRISHLDKEDKQTMLNCGDDIDAMVMLRWQRLDMLNMPVHLADIIQLGIYPQNAEAVAKIVDIRRVLRYLHKQKHGMMGDYADYLGECQKLGMDMKDRTVLFPKNLIAQHRNTSKQINLRANELLDMAYQKKQRPRYREYEFTAGGLFVAIPKNMLDLIEEGKQQHNCVGGYIRRVSEGETDVVFIRRQEKPMDSYVTMEIRNGEIIQARSKYNGQLDAQATAFVEAFKKEKLQKKRKRVSA